MPMHGGNLSTNVSGNSFSFIHFDILASEPNKFRKFID